MTLDRLIRPDSVLCNAHARSKKHCLEILSELLSHANPDVASEEIFSKLVERERLGCTGLDKGSAFPHCRIEGLTESSGAFIKLSSPIDFDSANDDFVDLVFGLMVPADMDESHYTDTRFVAKLLAKDILRDDLRAATTSRELHQILLECDVDATPETSLTDHV